ncbi:MAG: hypothetical protein Ct9H300mP12_08390 [Acidimicrobiales bacterium]|nr:MAG: hypothetical protein Ct9H300mP12_08390 [Acidimicrobiales bacterium]
MHIANVEGRGSLVIDGRMSTSNGDAGEISSDPMELVDLRIILCWLKFN